jgi:hypothetical protein
MKLIPVGGIGNHVFDEVGAEVVGDFVFGVVAWDFGVAVVALGEDAVEAVGDADGVVFHVCFPVGFFFVFG